MTAADVCEYFAASREWLRLRLLHSNFPRPIRFSEGRSAHRRWSLKDIERWQDQRIAADLAALENQFTHSGKSLPDVSGQSPRLEV